MKQRILSLVALIFLMASMLVMPAAAAEDTPIVSPRYVNISLMTASIDINSSGKVSCYGDVRTANSSYTIYLNMGLQRYEDGYWTTIKSWSTSGTGDVTLDKSRYVTSGYYYRTGITATVYTSGGSFVETATIYSQSDYY